MPRRAKVERRDVLPDPRFNDKTIARFINNVMMDGKKGLAERIVYGALEIAEQRAKKDQMEIFTQAMRNVTPTLEVRPRRVGGQTLQVPVEIKPERRQALAFRWVIDNARKRSGKSMAEKLAGELLDAYNNTGNSVKKREDTFKMAEANKAYAHYKF